MRYFENVLGEMANEIKIVLTKNKMLENELALTKTRVQEEARRHEEYLKRDEERRRTDEERRRVEVTVRVREEARKEERRNSQQPASRRSVGKLIARRPNGSLNTFKIRI